MCVVKVKVEEVVVVVKTRMEPKLARSLLDLSKVSFRPIVLAFFLPT